MDKRKYVRIMRELLERHSLQPLPSNIQDIERIGTESIYLKDLIDRYGRLAGKTLFETLALSSELKAKIIAFGEVTVSLIKQVGTQVKKGLSKGKHELKKRAGIKTPLAILLFFMSPNRDEILKFIEEFQIQEIILDPLIIGPVGLIIYANG